MKTIKIKHSGIVTNVSDEYFKSYENGGWFIEVVPEPIKVTKAKSKPKEEEPKE